MKENTDNQAKLQTLLPTAKSHEMNRNQETQDNPCPDLNTIFAAELFSKLSKNKQDIIIEQIKDLLSHE